MAPAQANYVPTSATNLTVPLVHPGVSPLLNPGNGKWGVSGATPAPDEWSEGELVCVNLAGYVGDLGGIRDVPLQANIQPVLAPAPNATVHQFIPPGATSPWEVTTSTLGLPYSNSPIPFVHWRFRGYLRPPGVQLPPRQLPAGSLGGDPATGLQVDDAGFEVICAHYVPGKPDMIVIVTPPTAAASPLDGLGSDLGQAHGYPGWRGNNGVCAGGPADGLVTRYLLRQFEALGTAKPYNLILAQIHARLHGKPGEMQVQRNLELVRTVRQMFTTAPTDWRPGGWPMATEIPAIIVGGSFGGGVSYWMALMYPEDFQGAVSASGPPSPRRLIGESSASAYLASMSGFNAYGYGLSPDDYIHMESLGRQLAQSRGIATTFDPYYHPNVLTAIRSGTLKRTILLSQNDEETVSTGNDWQSLISGVRQWQGSFLVTNPTQPLYTIAFSGAEKRCHGDAPYSYPDPYNPGARLPHWEDLVVSFLNYLSKPANQGMLAPVVFAAPPPTVDAAEDPYEHVFMPTAVPPQPAPQPGTLRLDANFAGNTGASLQATVPAEARQVGKSFGSGLFLGAHDSLTTGMAYGSEDPTEAHEIFVGSAEGVVTRFAIGATGEMVPQAMSPALGWGAWGIALGEADFGHPGKEVIVATHRGLFTLYRQDLTIIDEVRNLPFDRFRPLHLAVADFLPGGRSELIAACQGGKLAAFDLDNPSTPIATWLEPSLIDFKVLNSQGNPVEMLLLTGRGHVAKVSWDLSTGNMTLLATSPRLNGAPADMELMSSGRVAVLTANGARTHQENIWVLNTSNLAPTTPSSFSFTRAVDDTQTLDPSGGSALDLEIYEDEGSATFLVLKNDRIIVIPEGGANPHVIELCAFQPMMRALDLAVAEVTGEGKPELLVSTEAGYVCWLPIADVVEPSGPTSVSGLGPQGYLLPHNSLAPNLHKQVRGHGVVNAAPTQCNRTTAGTWGLMADNSGGTLHLEALDHSGTRWQIDKDGNVTLRQEVGQEIGGLAGAYLPLAGPFRGLGKLIATPLANPSTQVSTPSLLLTPDPFPGLITQSSRTIATFPLVPSGQFVGQSQNFGGVMDWIVQGPTFEVQRHRLNVWDGYVAFPRGGDAFRVGNQFHVAWWSGEEYLSRFGNCIQGLRIEASTGQIQQWWSSLVPTNGATPGTLVPDANVARWDMRAYHYEAIADRQAQSLRLFSDTAGNQALRCAVFTPGARLIVVDPLATPGTTTMKENDAAGAVLDFGTGGLALAVKSGGDHDNIYLGSLSFFAEPSPSPTTLGNGGDQVAHVASLRWNGSSSFTNASIVRTKEFTLDGQAGRPKIYGVCGMAVGDILPNDGGEDELVIGSLDGHLLVYDLDPVTGAILGTGVPAFQTRVEGSLGNYNSIVIADLDGSGQNELYVAGSLGLRKWVFQP